MPMLAALTPLAVGLGLAGTPAPPADPIVGGEPVAAGAYPEVVQVVRGPYGCTGTVMAPDLVLTAAHCFGEGQPDPAQLAVLTGDDARTPDQVIAVVDYGRHPDFCNYIENPDCPSTLDLFDFAWVRLAEPLQTLPERYPAVITDEALHHRLVREGAEVLLVGYGDDDDGVLGRKREVTTSITAITPTGLEFRAGADGRDSCQGDSGGPAFARQSDGSLALLGVLSRGGECGEGGFYGATLSALCWVRDDSGVDVVPPGCSACDCVDLTPREESGCGSCNTTEQHATWGVALVLLVLLGRSRPRRRDR